MSSDIVYPKLRFPIDLRLENIDNQEIILITCPLGISKNPLALIAAVGPVISCFEGQMSVQEILNKFSPHGLTPELLTTLIDMLDENLFLATSRFYEAQSLDLQEFKTSKVRPAAMSGRVYSAIPDILKKEIENYLTSNQPEIKIEVSSVQENKICGIIAPHIDYRRGQITYGKTYNLIKNQNIDLYILVGTSHQFSKNIFILTAKDFDSPLGSSLCDTDFMHMLAKLYGEQRSFEEEILHKKEHSLELQVPFLKHLLPQTKIAPVLVGSFFHMLDSGKLPENFEEYDKFASSLTACIENLRKQGRTFCFIAGVDMAHVGMHFGDKEKLTPEFMSKVEEHDAIYIRHIINQDRKSLFAHIAEDMDRRRICGFPTIYTVIDVFDRLGIKYRSQLVEYRQAVDYSTDCAVTFAGMQITA